MRRGFAVTTLLLGMLACRGNGAVRADRSVADTSPAPSVSVSIGPDPSATPAPPPPPKPNPFLGPRDVPFSLIEFSYSYRRNDVRGARPDVLEGIDARAMGARLDAYIHARTLDPVPSTMLGTVMWTITPTLVTRRLISVSVSRFDLTLDAALAAKGMGGAAPDATMQYANWAFESPEGPAVELSLEELFAPGVDAREVVKHACEAIEASGAKEEPSGDPGADPPCTPRAFLLGSSGVSVIWSRTENLYQTHVRSAEVPWSVLAPHLRRGGPACSFRWESAADVDAGSKDPCL